MAQDSRTLTGLGAQLDRARARAFRGLGDPSVPELQSAFSQANRSARAAWTGGDQQGAQVLYQQAVALNYQIDPSGAYGSDDLAFTRSVMGQPDDTPAGAALNQITGSSSSSDAQAGGALLVRGTANARPDPNTGILGNLSGGDLPTLDPFAALAALSLPAKVGLGLAVVTLAYLVLRR